MGPRGLRLNIQARELSQFALAGVECAKVGGAQHKRSRHMQNVEAPGANNWGVALRQALRFLKKASPHVRFSHQGTGCQITLDLLPCGERFG